MHARPLTTSLSRAAADAVRALATNLANPQLRRAQAAFAGAWAAEWAFTVALSVVAYRDGGAAAVGLVAVIRMLPSALLAPALSAMADRMRRERVLIASSAIRAAATGAAAVALAADAPIAVVYALAVVSTIAVTPYRAAHSALLPSLCASLEELTSSNVVRGMLDSLSVLVGPLAAAALLAWTSPAAAFAAAAGIATWSALVLVGLRYEAPPRAEAPPSRLARDLAEGVRLVAADRDLALLLALGGVQTFTRGCLTVLTVVVAIDLLGTGDAGVGILTAAVGAGAVVGSLGAALLIGTPRLAQWFGISVALWGLPLLALAAMPQRPVALVALAIIGIANAILDVALFTLVPRLADERVLARVFGLLEALIAAAVALGSILTPVAVDALGTTSAIAVTGTVAPLAAAFAWRRLRRLDDAMNVRDAEIALLRSVSMLRPLPMPTIEQLARHAQPVHKHAGECVCEQGEIGDRFYVIAGGEALVRDGARSVTTLHTGEGFGEIALLRDVPRTSTVEAATELSLVAIGRADFTHAVTGYTGAAAAAGVLIDERLEELQQGRRFRRG